MKKTYFNWSSGKDASLALYHLQKNKTFGIDRLVTTVNSHFDRVSMHGLRKELLFRQAEAVGIALETIELPEQPSMEEYQEKMKDMVVHLQNEGYTHSGFGDIFLEDLRTYREEQLNPYGIECLFPLWQRDTKELLKEFLDLGFRAILICIKSELLDKSFIGREIDADFIDDLPEGVDPCGENGEFHTFCFDGPIFSKPVGFSVGEKIYREYKNPDQKEETSSSMGFWFCDLIPD